MQSVCVWWTPVRPSTWRRSLGETTAEESILSGWTALRLRGGDSLMINNPAAACCVVFVSSPRPEIPSRPGSKLEKTPAWNAPPQRGAFHHLYAHMIRLHREIGGDRPRQLAGCQFSSLFFLGIFVLVLFLTDDKYMCYVWPTAKMRSSP